MCLYTYKWITEFKSLIIFFLAQCVAMGCTQTCVQTSQGDYKCTCLSGYHLLEDKKTCVEKGTIENINHNSNILLFSYIKFLTLF